MENMKAIIEWLSPFLLVGLSHFAHTQHIVDTSLAVVVPNTVVVTDDLKKLSMLVGIKNVSDMDVKVRYKANIFEGLHVSLFSSSGHLISNRCYGQLFAPFREPKGHVIEKGKAIERAIWIGGLDDGKIADGKYLVVFRYLHPDVRCLPSAAIIDLGGCKK